MGLELNSQTWAADVEATPAEKQTASLYVAAKATGPADCRHLLDVLGLLPKLLRITDHGMAGYRKGCKCKQCRKANRDRNQRQRAKKTSVPASTVVDCPINTTEAS
ncbi:hypothetical protein [Streptomyces sp. NPDC005799]|uniref:hypothetical protein n=1 Tax=Streptomyces sp. NPDC005799 TaxID=3154678 RepID=UPI00340E7A9C